MGVPEVTKSIKKDDIKSVKTGNVVKLSKEVRKMVPNVATVKKSYYVNKASQVNKLIIKNKISAPVISEYKSNSVKLSYSPAVFKEAVTKVMDDINIGDCYETNKLDIKVKSVRPETDASGIKVTTLITLEVKALGKHEAPVTQQIHLYHLKQCLMVQGQRKISGIKGFKILVEDFLQPSIEAEIDENKDKIDTTKQMLNKVEEKREQNKFKKSKVSEDSKKTNNKMKHMNFECDMCEAKFVTKDRLNEHIKKAHEKNVDKCTICGITFDSNDILKKHLDRYHALIPVHQIKELSFKLSKAGYLELQKRNEAKEKFTCNYCKSEVTNRGELKTHMKIEHEETILLNDAQGVIKRIKDNLSNKYKDEEMEVEKECLKRSNSTSPKGPKGKTSKTNNSKAKLEKVTKESKTNMISDLKEDLKLTKQECKDLNTENKHIKEQLNIKENELNKTLQAVVDTEALKRENNEMKAEMKVDKEEIAKVKMEMNALRVQLEQQEFEAIKAMNAIAEEVEKETAKYDQTNKEESGNMIAKGQKEFKKLEKEYKSKLAEVKQEKDNIMNDMVEMQTKTDMLEEKVKSMEKEKKIKENLKIFESIETKTIEHSPDECINLGACLGDCDKVSQAKRLSDLKQSGSKRTCPQLNPQQKPMLYCNVCTFMSQNKVYFESHMKKHKEENNTKQRILACTQCGFKAMSKERLSKHISDEHSISVQDMNNSNKKGPCRFFGTNNGCNMGYSCLFDHSPEAQAQSVTKVPKLCRLKQSCGWKPRCRYVHPEDGESLPVQRLREGPREGVIRNCFYPNNCPRGGPVAQGGFCSYFHPNSPRVQDFVSLDYSQQPPGWSRLPPPAQDREQEQEVRGAVRVIVPNRRCLKQYPNLPTQ